MSIIAAFSNMETVKEVPKADNMKEIPTFRKMETWESQGESRYIICRNETLEGDRHPLTGVEFERKEVELPDDTRVEGVFPKFDSLYEAKLDESQYLDSDAKQFKEANHQLQESIENDPDVRDQFSDEQLDQIAAGDTPDGYVWHHSEEAGTLQLVDSEIHAQTGHTGGRSIWGGGSDHR